MKLYFLLAILVPFFALANAGNNLMKIEKLGKSKSSSSYKAKKEIQENLVLELSRELVVQLIGQEEYSRKRAGVDRVIKTHFGKYVPYMKAGKIKKTSTGFEQVISFEVSMNSLRDVLSQEGLLYDKLKTVKILPIISYLDSFEAKSFKWWYSKEPGKHSFLWDMFQKSQREMRTQFWEEGFYLQNPVSHEYSMFLNDEFKVEAHRKADLVRLAKSLGADLVVFGGLRVGVSDENSRVSSVRLSLKALLVNNLRNVAEVNLKWNTAAGDYKEKVRVELGKKLKEAVADLSVQIKDAYQKGKFGTKTMQLVLKGKFNYKDFESIKQSIRLSNYQIKSLKERRLSNGEYTLELDVSGKREKLIKHFGQWKLEGWNLSLGDSSLDNLEIEFARK